jgi:hypothetical protein
MEIELSEVQTNFSVELVHARYQLPLEILTKMVD